MQASGLLADSLLARIRFSTSDMAFASADADCVSSRQPIEQIEKSSSQIDVPVTVAAYIFEWRL